ncbi:MAG: VacJ family lipoprotein [Erythrobacter sp.]|nr:VacJ family lipoprotein [Erythrobacter sp.]MDZ4271425.1 VacJ family lipoprotein [Erythrobacter sp.]
MPGLLLISAPPALFGAALSAAGPVPAPPPQAYLPVTPIMWSLAAVQDSAPPADADPATVPSDEQDDDAQGNEIIIEGSYGPPAGDPAEQFNAESYRISQAVDQALVEPLAYAYRDGLPEPIRDGLGNVVRNLGEPSNALNFLLQGKIGKTFETLGRLAINSTLGLGGLIDVAGKPGIGLPYRRNGFANTFGYYGGGSGPYLYLPITGATTVRDTIGGLLDQALLPFVVGKPFDKFEYAAAYFVVNGLDSRLEFDAELAEIRESEDPYGMRRETYLERRRREIAALKGEVIEEPEAEDAAPTPPDDLPPEASLSLSERLQITAGQAPGGR